MSKVLKRLSITHEVKNGTPFLGDRDLRNDMIVALGELRDALIPVYHQKGLLIQEAFADQNVAIHLRNGSDYTGRHVVIKCTLHSSRRSLFC